MFSHCWPSIVQRPIIYQQCFCLLVTGNMGMDTESRTTIEAIKKLYKKLIKTGQQTQFSGKTRVWYAYSPKLNTNTNAHTCECTLEHTQTITIIWCWNKRAHQDRLKMEHIIMLVFKLLEGAFSKLYKVAELKSILRKLKVNLSPHILY